MKRKLTSIFGFLAVLFLIATDSKSLAASGQYAVYLPTIVHVVPTWQEAGTGSATDGGISNTAGYWIWPSIALAPDGTPYVAWEDDSSGNGEIYVRAWNGSNWAEVGAGSASGGGISNNSGWSDGSPSLALAPDGTPFVAWRDDSSGDFETYVRRYIE